MSEGAIISKKIKKKYKHIKSDALVKKIMSDKIAAQEFLNEYLPENFKSFLDLNTVKVEKESYIEESLKRQLSDIVYSVKTKNNQDAFVYILLEAQSSVDNFIAFRLWKYTLLLLERHLSDKLPLIAPIVLYHGKNKYTAAKSLWDLFDDKDIAKQLMGDKYLLVDLQSMSDADIKKKQHLGMLEFFLKHIHMRDMLKLWEEFFANFQKVIRIDKENGYIYIKAFLYYTDPKVENDKKEELTRLILSNLPKDDGEKLMYSIADAYIDQGVAQGVAQGLVQGKVEIARKLLSQSYSISDVSDITGLSAIEINKLK